MKIKRVPLAAKVIAFQLIFLVAHYLYDWFPNGATYLLGTTSESIFQHMKATFFSYLIITAIEYGLTHAAIQMKVRYLHSRLFGAVLMPLLMNVFYFTAAAYIGQLHSIPAEIIFANLALLALSFTTFHLEDYFAQSEPSRALKWVLPILFLVTASEIVIFNYRLPWLDVFATPPGW
jgi:hypothetical protein